MTIYQEFLKWVPEELHGFLVPQLNPEATNINELCDPNPNIPPLKTPIYRSLKDNTWLSLYLQYAPEEKSLALLEQLFTPTQQSAFIYDLQDSFKSIGKTGKLYHLLRFAPQSVQTKLLHWLNQQTSENKSTILLGEPSLFGIGSTHETAYTRNIQLIDNLQGPALQEFEILLKSLDDDDFMGIFQVGMINPHYGFFLTLLQDLSEKHEKITILLSRCNSLDTKKWHHLFKGAGSNIPLPFLGASPFTFANSLQYCVSMPIALSSQLLPPLKKLEIDQIKTLFQQASAPHPCALERICTQESPHSDDISLLFLRYILEEPALLPLITTTLLSSKKTALELLVTHARSKLVRQLLEEYPILLPHFKKCKTSAKFPDFQALCDSASIVHALKNGDAITPLSQKPTWLHTRWAEGRTMLHLAVQYKNTTLITELLTYKAALLPDAHNFTPFDYALQQGDSNSIAILAPHTSLENSKTLSATIQKYGTTTILSSAASPTKHPLGALLHALPLPQKLIFLDTHLGLETEQAIWIKVLLQQLSHEATWSSYSNDEMLALIERLPLESQKTLAQHYFQHSPLHLFSPQLLQKFMRLLGSETLSALCEKRQDLLLAAITLEENPQCTQAATCLARSCASYNTQPEALAPNMLWVLMNTCYDARVIEKIESLFHQYSTLQEEKQQCILNYDQNTPFMPSSWYAQALKEWATDSTNSTHPAYPTILQALLQHTPGDRLLPLLQKMPNLIEHQNILAKAFPTHPDTLHAFNAWLSWSAQYADPHPEDPFLLYLLELIKTQSETYHPLLKTFLESSPKISKNYQQALHVFSEYMHFTPEGIDTSLMESLLDYMAEEAHPWQVGTVHHLIRVYAETLTTSSIEKQQEHLYLISQLVSTLPLEAEIALIQSFSLHTLQQILPIILQGLSANDVYYQKNCQYLLRCFCKRTLEEIPRIFTYIKNTLDTQNLSCLGNENLALIGHAILKEPVSPDLQQSTINGVWIQRLLVNPRFIHQITSAQLQQLVTRYRCLSLMLKQDEFDQINAWLKGKLPPDLKPLQQQLMSQPGHKQRMLKRRDKILAFRTEASIRALLQTLQEACEDPIHAAIKVKTLETLSTFYHQHIANIRLEGLAKWSEQVHRRWIRQQGELTIAHNALLQWLDKHLPHKTFEQCLLQKNPCNKLYDAHKKLIAQVNEQGKCTFTESQKISANQFEAVYDEHGFYLGTIHQDGYLHADSASPDFTSIHILHYVPLSTLKTNPIAIQILLENILNHDLLDSTLQAIPSEDTEKLQWIKTQLFEFLKTHKGQIHSKHYATLSHYFSTEQLHTLLSASKHPSLRFHLLLAIWKNPEHKNWYLKNPKILNSAVGFFIKAHGSEKAWLELWKHCSDTPDSHELLAILIAKTPKASNVFLQSLLTLCEQNDSATFDKIMSHLLSDQATAQILLHQLFLNKKTFSFGNLNETFQSVSLFVFKKHIISALRQLHNEQDWLHDARYLLILGLMNTHKEHFFSDKELCLTETSGWKAEEISLLCAFVKRHRQYAISIDPTQKLTRVLLEETTFRAANAGITDWLYKDPENVDDELLHTIVYQPEPIGTPWKTWLKKCSNTAKTVFHKLDTLLHPKKVKKEAELQKNFNELKKEKVAIDWTEIKTNTWLAFGEKTVPLGALFLSQFVGKAENIKPLLETYFKSIWVQSDPQKPLLSIASLLNTHANSDIAACLYEHICKLLPQNPSILDLELLKILTTYAAKSSNNASEQEKTLSFLKTLGQAQEYPLVQKVCTLLLNDLNKQSLPKKILSKIHDPFRSLLTQIQKEIQLETRLKHYMGRWYYPLLQWGLRGWHYGFRKSKRRWSTYIRYCDEKPYSNYNAPLYIESQGPGLDSVTKILNWLNAHKPQLLTLKDKLLKIKTSGTGTKTTTPQKPEPSASVTPVPTSTEAAAATAISI
ncbi:MAG: hypothetical protein Q8R79_02815 [Legionellaceae bacterium]|nr:hypothetical protein [Legionellaceae bacterium]